MCDTYFQSVFATLNDRNQNPQSTDHHMHSMLHFPRCSSPCTTLEHKAVLSTNPFGPPIAIWDERASCSCFVCLNKPIHMMQGTITINGEERTASMANEQCPDEYIADSLKIQYSKPEKGSNGNAVPLGTWVEPYPPYPAFKIGNVDAYKFFGEGKNPCKDVPKTGDTGTGYALCKFCFVYILIILYSKYPLIWVWFTICFWAVQCEVTIFDYIAIFPD